MIESKDTQWDKIAERIRYTALYTEGVYENEVMDEYQLSVCRSATRLLRKIAQDVRDLAQGKEIQLLSIDQLPASKGYDEECKSESAKNYDKWLRDSNVLCIGPKVLE